MRPSASCRRPGTREAAQILGDGETGLQAVLVEARAEIGAAKPGVVLALQATTAVAARASFRC